MATWSWWETFLIRAARTQTFCCWSIHCTKSSCVFRQQHTSLRRQQAPLMARAGVAGSDTVINAVTGASSPLARAHEDPTLGLGLQAEESPGFCQFRHGRITPRRAQLV